MNTATMSAPPLAFENLSIGFESKILLENESCVYRPGMIYGIHGSNGCGKTSLLNCLSGLVKPITGQICHYGESLIGRSCWDISTTGHGLVRSFQVPVIATDLSVGENILLSIQSDVGMLGGLSRFYSTRRKELDIEKQYHALISRYSISEIWNMPASNLSYGMRRLVSSLRAVYSKSKCLLLDEPFANLSATYVQLLGEDIVASVRNKGRTVVIVEHTTDIFDKYCDETYELINAKLKRR